MKFFARILKHVKKYWILYSEGTVSYARSIGVTIGDDCRIYITHFSSEPFLIEIGDRVTITEGVRILTHDGSTILFTDEKGRRFDYRRVIIGSDVFIGTRSIILPGVRIGNEVIVGAGSVVTKSIPSGSIVVGNPARIVSTFRKKRKESINNLPSLSDLDFKLEYNEMIEKVYDRNFRQYLENDKATK